MDLYAYTVTGGVDFECLQVVWTLYAYRWCGLCIITDGVDLASCWALGLR